MHQAHRYSDCYDQPDDGSVDPWSSDPVIWAVGSLPDTR
jgi:hypothetical protein